jgi:hypothetical protein
MHEPHEILEARRLLLRHRRESAAVVVVPLAGAGAMVVAFASRLPVLGLALFVALVGVFGALAMRVLGQEAAAESARRAIAAWEARDPDADLHALLARIGELGGAVDGVGELAARAEARLNGLREDRTLLEQAIAAKSAEVAALSASLRGLHAALAADQGVEDRVREVRAIVEPA